MARSRLRVAIDWASGSAALDKQLFTRWIRAALPPDTCGEIGVRVVDEAESATLNERYRGRKGATNVLAFEADPEAARLDPMPPIGDLVICAGVVENEARDQHKAARAHWAHIVVHGALHLVGYDHDSDRTAHVMEDKEREVLARLGYPDPYRARGRAG